MDHVQRIGGHPEINQMFIFDKVSDFNSKETGKVVDANNEYHCTYIKLRYEVSGLEEKGPKDIKCKNSLSHVYLITDSLQSKYKLKTGDERNEQD